MNKTTYYLTMALEALEEMAGNLGMTSEPAVITDIKEALAQEKALQALHSENERLGLYKDAYAQPEQEPVAWRELCRRLYVELFHCDQQMMAALDEEGYPMWQQGETVRDVLTDAKTALETSPPQRTWAGLTEEEIDSCDWGQSEHDYAKAIEAKLKQKNGYAEEKNNG